MIINKENSKIHVVSIFLRSGVKEWDLWKVLKNREGARS